MVHKPTFAPRLVVIEGNDKGKVIPLSPGTTVIGRSKGDVLVSDPRISRSHVAIQFDEKTGKLTFTDLKSLNGTLVNGEGKEGGELRDGDRMLLGNTLFDCQVVSPVTNTIPLGAPLLGTRTDINHPEPREPFLPSMDNAPPPTPLPMAPLETSGVVPQMDETTDTFRLPRWRRWYLGFPRRARVYALAGFTLLMVGLYLIMGGEGIEAAERALSSIRALEAEGKLTEAVAKAEETRKRHPDKSIVHRTLGDLYAQQGKIALAVEAYHAGLLLDPNDTVLHVKLARVYLVAGQLKDAEVQNRQIDRILIEGPHSREFFVEVAKLYIDFRTLDVPAKKMIIIGQALQNKYAPGDTAGMKLEAKGLILEEQAPEAMAVLEKARLADPTDETVLNLLVIAKVTAKDTEGATKVVADWMKAFPRSVPPRLFMAHWKFETGDRAESLKYVQEILQLTKTDDPSLGDALNLMGRISEADGKLEEARQSLKRACSLGHQPSCENALLHSDAVPPPEESAANAPAASPKNP